jgi:hypothetical protein
MNIFYLDPDPKTCAEMHCDKHVVKMIIEYAQLMSTAHRVIDGEQYTDLTANGRRIQRWRLDDEREHILYKASHMNHPSAIWCRENLYNYQWLYTMWSHLLDEYTHRYGKIHSCQKLQDVLQNWPENIPLGEFFAPTPAMPVDLKVLAENPVPGRKYDSLKSYHKYYIQEKVRFAKWKNRNIPEWFVNASLSVSQ